MKTYTIIQKMPKSIDEALKKIEEIEKLENILYKRKKELWKYIYENN